MWRFRPPLPIVPTVASLGMDSGMTALTKCDEVVSYVGSSLRQGKKVMNLLGSYEAFLLKALLTERMV